MSGALGFQLEIIKAKILGFCMGVRRAVEIAAEEAKRTASVCTLGPLIHNPKVLNDLNALGIKIINDTSCPLNDDCTVIIRAHGISPKAEKELSDKGVRIVDATCPRVKANQLKIQELVKEGYFIFLAGEKEHAEITGLIGYAESELNNQEQVTRYIVVGNAAEAKKAAFKAYKLDNDARTALLGQTTISQEEYFSIGEEFKMFFPNLEIINTICAATGERQQALREIIPLVDAVIVAGGEHSANTRRLLTIANESGKPCVLAQSALDIPASFYSFKKIGLCAGASTPDSILQEIEEGILNKP